MSKVSQFQLYGDFSDRLTGRDFWFQCDSVAALYERCFAGDVRADTAQKITVNVRKQITSDHLKELGIQLAVDVVGDSTAFFRLNDRAKQESALNWLHSGCLAAAKHFHWPKGPFNNAWKGVRDAQFVNTWKHKRAATSQDRKYRAELHCEQGIYEFKSELVVVAARGGREIARFPDLTMQPDRMIFGWSLGRLRWLSSAQVEIRNVRGGEPRIIDVGKAIEGP